MKTMDWSKVTARSGSRPEGKRPDRLGERRKPITKSFPHHERGAAATRRGSPLRPDPSVWEAAAKDPATKEALVASFVAAEKELVDPLIQWKFNGRPAGNGWNSPVNNAQWGTDYLNRTGTSMSNMYDNMPEETKYIYRDFDSQGQQLDGKNRLHRHVPERAGATGQRFLVANPL